MARSSSSTVPGAIAFAAVLTAAAGAIHIAAAVSHFADSTLLGVGFVGMGLVQITLAILLSTRSPGGLVIGGVLFVHVVALASWAVSRSVGLPVGHPGPEPVGHPGLVTVTLEVAAIGLLAWSMRPHGVSTSSRDALPSTARPMALSLLVLVAGVAASGTTWAVAGLATGHGEEPDHADDGGHDLAMSADDAAAEAMADVDNHADDVAGADDDHDDGSDRAMVESSRPQDLDAQLVHAHSDDSLHIHAVGPDHRHDDGTVHIHEPMQVDAGGADDSLGTEPALPAESPNEQPPGDDHAHAPGEEH